MWQCLRRSSLRPLRIAPVARNVNPSTGLSRLNPSPSSVSIPLPWRQIPSQSFRSATQPRFRPAPQSSACPVPRQPAYIQQRYRFYSQWPRRNNAYTYVSFDGRGGGGTGGGGKGPRFIRALLIWEQYKVWIVTAGVGSVLFYIWNLEVVPMTGRRRFNFVPANWEASFGQTAYEEMLQEHRGRILPESHELVRYVDEVFQRLVLNGQPELEAGDEIMKNTKWKVHVVDSPEKNACVLPGGNVFVFTGILGACGDKDGLASVLGHEMAHVLAHHMAERMSTHFIGMAVAMGVAFLFDISGNVPTVIYNLVTELPNSRTQEKEADEIGLMIMAKACFNPAAAAQVWARIQQIDKHSPPQILSTHPSNRSRQEAIEGWQMRANAVYENSGCSVPSEYIGSFGQAVEGFW
ncbi:hypothetical protein FQN50_000638 [Emmonsiellopsis sp. PD_5]|nr:hypothetical protein FQN50_000638 [Emmonsiellopsis sp. PD_5]